MNRRLLSRFTAFALLAIAIVYVVSNRSGIVAIDGSDSVWMAIFASNEVVVAARLAIIAGALYAVASFVGLIIEGRWLTKAGPSGAEADPVQALSRADERTIVSVDSLGRRLRRLEEALVSIEDDMQEFSAIIYAEEIEEE